MEEIRHDVLYPLRATQSPRASASASTEARPFCARFRRRSARARRAPARAAPPSGPSPFRGSSSATSDLRESPYRSVHSGNDDTWSSPDESTRAALELHSMGPHPSRWHPIQPHPVRGLLPIVLGWTASCAKIITKNGFPRSVRMPIT